MAEADQKGKGGDNEGGIPHPEKSSQNPMQGNSAEDLAALDRLITYLLGQPSTSNNPTNSNLDSLRRSFRASARGYRPLRPNDGPSDTSNHGMGSFGIGTTPL